MKWGGRKWVKDVGTEKTARIADAQNDKTSLMKEANHVISLLQDAVDLDMAIDDDIGLLTAWKRYRVLLSHVNPDDAADIEWPNKP